MPCPYTSPMPPPSRVRHGTRHTAYTPHCRGTACRALTRFTIPPPSGCGMTPIHRVSRHRKGTACRAPTRHQCHRNLGAAYDPNTPCVPHRRGTACRAPTIKKKFHSHHVSLPFCGGSFFRDSEIRLPDFQEEKGLERITRKPTSTSPQYPGSTPLREEQRRASALLL